MSKSYRTFSYSRLLIAIIMLLAASATPTAFAQYEKLGDQWVDASDIRFDRRTPIQKRPRGINIPAATLPQIGIDRQYIIYERREGTADFSHALSDSLDVIAECYRLKSQCDIMLESLGKTVSNDSQKILLDDIVSIILGRESKVIDATPDVVRIINRGLSQTDVQLIGKDYHERRVSKKLRNPLQNLSALYMTRIESLISDPTMLKSTIEQAFDRSSISNPETLYSKLWPRQYSRMSGATAVIRYDTIANPIYYGKISRIPEYRELAVAALRSGYEWVAMETGEYRSERYPHDVQYTRYQSHPDLRVIDAKIYDKKGNLIAVSDIDINETLSYSGGRDTELGRQIAIFAYRTDAYEIQSSSSKATRDYITQQLGLRQMTAAEKARQDKAAEKMANAMAEAMLTEARHGQKSRKTHAQNQQSALLMLDAMLEGANGYFDDAGNRWLEQISDDYNSILSNWSKIERIDPVTFRATYEATESTPPFTVTLSYRQTAPYTVTLDTKLSTL